jgi:hypothetical protein
MPGVPQAVKPRKEKPMYRRTFLLVSALAAVALVLAAPAAADAPVRVSSTVILGPFVDDEACAFPITTMVERTRATLTFGDGDVQSHTQLVVTTSANGKTLVERDAFSVFIASDSPDVWVITGSFTHARLLGDGTIALQSGRIVYDVQADQISDPHPGPHPTGLVDVVCDVLL